MTKRFWLDIAKTVVASGEWDDTFSDEIRCAEEKLTAREIEIAAWGAEGEWLGGWLYDPKFAPVFLKHKVHGRIVFQEDGDVMGQTAVIFDKGVLYEGVERTTWSKGQQIG